MHSPITLDSLRVIDAIHRKGSFAAAAQELYRVPSAISYTVSKLEEDLGVSIFDRTKRKAELTEAGTLILEHGRRILLATEELTSLAKQVAGGWEVSITIAVDSVVCCDVVYEIIEQFQELYPKTNVNLIEEVLGGTWDALSTERCDLVVGAEGEPPGPGFEMYSIGEVSFGFAVATDHELAKTNGVISREQIYAYPTIVMADSSRSLAVRSVGLLDGRSTISVPNLQKKIEAQVKGLGVGYLPLHRIQPYLDAGALTLLELEKERPNQRLSIAWRKNDQGNALKWFANALKENKHRLLEPTC